MELTVRRTAKRQGYTIGKLSIDGEYFCDTLEDADRGLTADMPPGKIRELKVYGQTAIPTGRYAVTLDVVSPRFKDRSWARPYGGRIPRLLSVPGFEGGYATRGMILRRLPAAYWLAGTRLWARLRTAWPRSTR